MGVAVRILLCVVPDNRVVREEEFGGGKDAMGFFKDGGRRGEDEYEHAMNLRLMVNGGFLSFYRTESRWSADRDA